MMRSRQLLLRRTRAFFSAVLFAASLTCFSTASQATEIAVVASPDVSLKQVDHSALRRIFLKKKLTDQHHTPLIPVNLPTIHPVRAAFSRAVLGESAKATARYWNKQYFLGVSPPYVLDSQEAVLRFVRETPGSIGYVLDCLADDRVQILFRIKISASLRDKLNPFCVQSGQH